MFQEIEPIKEDPAQSKQDVNTSIPPASLHEMIAKSRVPSQQQILEERVKRKR